MGFWSSLCSGFSKVFSPIANAIAPILQNSPLLQKLMPILAVVIPPPFDVVAVIALEVISAAMGKPENPEELGWQMNEADKKPEDFGSFDEYKEYLDREYPFDRDAFNAQTDEQKAACRYAGVAGTMEELKNATGFELNPKALGVLAGAGTALGWGPEAMKSFTQGMWTALGTDGDLFNRLGDFAKGDMTVGESEKMKDGVAAGVKEAGVSDSPSAVTTAMTDIASNNENL